MIFININRIIFKHIKFQFQNHESTYDIFVIGGRDGMNKLNEEIYLWFQDKWTELKIKFTQIVSNKFFDNNNLNDNLLYVQSRVRPGCLSAEGWNCVAGGNDINTMECFRSRLTGSQLERGGMSTKVTTIPFKVSLTL